MTLVKICGITNQADAQAAVAAGAQALGFNFYPRSPRYISPRDAAAIAASLPCSVLKVGVFVNDTPETVAAIVAEAGLDVAQLHGDESPNGWPEGLRIWKAFRVDAHFHISKLAEFPAEAYLLDTPTDLYGGSGQTFDWALARQHGQRIVIAGGLDEHNVRQAIATAQPWGVDACSRLETRPGMKDHGRVARFAAAALTV